MRRHLALGLLAALTAAGGFPAQAQVVDPYAQYYYRSPGQRANPYHGAPPGYFYYDPPPQRRVYRAPQPYSQPAPRAQPEFSLRRLFGYEEEGRRQRAVPRIKPKPAAPVVAKQEKPKVDPSTHVVVFGDALADLTGQGLDDAFSDTPEVAVVRKTRPDSSLAREGAEWTKSVQDTLNTGQKITLAVVMLGSGERPAIREGETSHEPLSERW